MSVAANTVLRVVAEALLPGTVVAQNVFYCKFLDDGTSNADQDVVDDCVDWLDEVFNNLNNQLQTQIAPGECKVFQWDAIGLDWDELGSNTMTYSTDNADHMLPHGVAAVVTGRTVDPDVNGRKYFAGFGEDMCTESTLAGAALTSLLLAAADWITPFTGVATASGFDPGVWSGVQVEFKKFVTNFIVNGIVGYQRRRKPGVGI